MRAGHFWWVDGGHYPYATCHVDNVCEGALLAWQRGRPGACYALADATVADVDDFRAFAGELLRTQGLAAPDRSVSRAVARGAAWLVEVGARIAGGRPLLTRELLHLLGEPLVVDDRAAREELGYQGRVSRAQGLRDLGHGAPGIGDAARRD